MSYDDECPRDRDIDQLQSDLSHLERKVTDLQNEVSSLRSTLKAAIQELRNIIAYHQAQDHERTPGWRPEIETAINNHLKNNHERR